MHHKIADNMDATQGTEQENNQDMVTNESGWIWFDCTGDEMLEIESSCYFHFLQPEFVTNELNHGA